MVDHKASNWNDLCNLVNLVESNKSYDENTKNYLKYILEPQLSHHLNKEVSIETFAIRNFKLLQDNGLLYYSFFLFDTTTNSEYTCKIFKNAFFELRFRRTLKDVVLKKI